MSVLIMGIIVSVWRYTLISDISFSHYVSSSKDYFNCWWANNDRGGQIYLMMLSKCYDHQNVCGFFCWSSLAEWRFVCEYLLNFYWRSSLTVIEIGWYCWKGITKKESSRTIYHDMQWWIYRIFPISIVMAKITFFYSSITVDQELSILDEVSSIGMSV